ncbi:class I SAM-dependent methyltransferase [Dyella koreensis]|uniref:class I SAM-dependent methyltransferase n=1 Tax=Dyella koreensis TaxID=311235 RepID=UPI0036121880
MNNAISNELTESFAAIAQGDTGRAQKLLEAATAQGSLLARALADLLGSGEHGTVYDQPAAFEAFIRGGDNMPLYAAVSAALAHLYDAFAVNTLLDVGCGDGMALIPALAQTGHIPSRVDLVEPSPALLSHATGQLASSARLQQNHIRTWPLTAQAFCDALEPSMQWDLAQASFSLQNLPPSEREQTLRRLRPHLRRLALIEFDVPPLVYDTEAYFISLAQRYERALRAYHDDALLIAGGFLAPMLLGQVRQTTKPSNWEQPISAWVEELQRAGYTVLRTEKLFDYSWSPAVLMLAEPGASA